MLKLYATEAIRNRFALIYRGYDLEVTRAPSDDLPILRRSDFYAADQDRAVIQAKHRIDGALLS
jgi:hypothetical protein